MAEVAMVVAATAVVAAAMVAAAAATVSTSSHTVLTAGLSKSTGQQHALLVHDVHLEQ